MTGDGAGDEGKPETGKAAVRLHLIERLNAAGLQRPRGMTAEAFAQMLGHLCELLSYMTADNLMTLAETLIEGAQGGRWPAEFVVRDFANRLQRRPAAQSRLITSWLASVEGPKAVARGDLVELLRFLRRKNQPPSDWDMRQIADEARTNARHCQIIKEKIAAEVAGREDREWLVVYQRDRDAALAIVDQGNARRAGDAA